jgi:hypothetical protein
MHAHLQSPAVEHYAATLAGRPMLGSSLEVPVRRDTSGWGTGRTK